MAQWTNVKITTEQKEHIDKLRGQVPLARWVAQSIEGSLKGAEFAQGGPDLEDYEPRLDLARRKNDAKVDAARPSVRRKVDRSAAPADLPRIAKRS